MSSVVKRAPSVEDYNRVRVAASLSEKDAGAAEVGLANTVFGVRVESEGRIVGIGRIVGDGALFFEVVDIAVLPEYQGKGSGRRSWPLSSCTWGGTHRGVRQPDRRPRIGVLRAIRVRGALSRVPWHVADDPLIRPVPQGHQPKG